MAKTPRVDITSCTCKSASWNRAEWEGTATLIYHYGLWGPSWQHEVQARFKVSQSWQWLGLMQKDFKFSFVDGKPKTIFDGAPEEGRLINMYEPAVIEHIFTNQVGIQKYERIRRIFWRVASIVMIALVLALLFGCIVALPL